MGKNNKKYRESDHWSESLRKNSHLPRVNLFSFSLFISVFVRLGSALASIQQHIQTEVYFYKYHIIIIIIFREYF